MKALVTGAAGFIGSHLSERLLKEGLAVVGVDCFTDYYPVKIKEKNISSALKHKNFRLINKNLLEIDLNNVLDGIDLIFHHAAQPGVRANWGKTFEEYVENNIYATQRLLEALRAKKIIKMIYASSSSVYGDAEKLPTSEKVVPKPVSPYGVTKLAAENLCYVYFKNYDIPVVSLRYFSVYGPRQRPDMGFNRFIRSIINKEEMQIYGSGTQTRDFTYVNDVIDADIRALDGKCKPGETYNVGGGSRISVNDAVRIIEDISGKKAKIKYLEAQKGETAHTSADISKAKSHFGYSPRFDIKTGLKREYEWIKETIRPRQFPAAI